MMKSPFARPSKAILCRTQKLCRTMQVLQVLRNHLLTDESRASWLVKATVACTFLPSSRVLCSEGGTGDSEGVKGANSGRSMNLLRVSWSFSTVVFRDRSCAFCGSAGFRRADLLADSAPMNSTINTTFRYPFESNLLPFVVNPPWLTHFWPPKI